MNSNSPDLVNRLMMWVVRRVLSLRYRLRLHGLEAVESRGRTSVVFLPEHPALIDPIILLAILYPRFAPRSVADEVQIGRPFIGPAARRLGARVLPNLEVRGASGLDSVRRVIRETVEGVAAGENLLIYPAGHLKHTRFEEIGGASAVKEIIDNVPAARVVLVRQKGLWGSRFSRAFAGTLPPVGSILRFAALALTVNGAFFMPRRKIDIEFVEPADFPRHQDRLTQNRYLEAFYNAEATPNTRVPYFFWDRRGPQVLPEPAAPATARQAAAVPDSVKKAVIDYLEEVSGNANISLDDRLGADLGLDSLAASELVVWLEREFGVSLHSAASLVTVGDAVIAAAGRGVAGAVEIRGASKRWFRKRSPGLADVPEGDDILGVFLRQAASDPSRIVVADQVSGEKSYREIITAVLLLKPLIEELPGRYVGLMFPASVGAVVFYLSALAAGKTPVMVNWTTGPRHVAHALGLLGVERVLTSRALVSRLDALGVDLGALRERFLMVEDLRGRLSLTAKLAALARSLVSWRALRSSPRPEHAVVLFTSGSETLPKAVPLTHRNILTNVRDIPRLVPVRKDDALVGILPPFHSFGLTVTMVLPIVMGIRTVYHPNPTEAGVIARIVEAHKVTLLVGTPAFLEGIVNAARRAELASLRIAVTGAEKCPVSLYDTLESGFPHLRVIEGYGITECSPVVAANSFEAPVRESIGRLLPSVEGAIVPVETGRRVVPGEAGMLLVRGPSVFGGYLGHEGQSPFVELEGMTWYRTGDLVRQREDGVLFFEGRLKRFVKIAGEMISLPAIESALLARYKREEDEGPPLAVEAIDSEGGTEIVLFTRLDLSRNEVNETLRKAGFGPLYNIRKVVRVETIPVLGTGKTDYRALVASVGPADRVPS